MLEILHRSANKNPPIMRITYRSRPKRGGHVRVDSTRELGSLQATGLQASQHRRWQQERRMDDSAAFT